MELKVGEFYLTEDGRIIKIAEKCDDNNYLDGDDYYYNKSGINDITDTKRNIIAYIPKELHYKIYELINDYHTNDEVKVFIDSNYENKSCWDCKYSEKTSGGVYCMCFLMYPDFEYCSDWKLKK